MPLPGIKLTNNSPFKVLSPEAENNFDCSLDGVSVLGLPRAISRQQENRLVTTFLSGFRKLLSKDDNWTFWQQLKLSLESCVRCQTCSEACPIYIASGRQEIYRPTFRLEVLRRIKGKYIDSGGAFSWLTGNNIELNWAMIARLAELAYRCTMCRRCAQSCPMGVDNGLITREIRKLLSQEMGIAPKELHDLGTVPQLSGNGNDHIKEFYKTVRIMESDIGEITGKLIKIPVDVVGADVLFIHSSNTESAWLASLESFAIIFGRANISWTISSEIGFQGGNFGVWYDDIQFARIAFKQIEIARKLKVKKIVVGECGHANKGMVVLADRILVAEANLPRETYLPLIEDLVCNGKLELDPRKNNFPVTLHDPCNIVRQMGIVEPQRRILRRICPQFREMDPHGVENYCCGGGSGFNFISSTNFFDWRMSIAGRMKAKQILETFQDIPDPSIKKYTCTPCFTCKSQMSDLFRYYDLEKSYGITYGGLVELIVNAMPDIKKPIIKW